jgi:hypothetical protein
MAALKNVKKTDGTQTIFGANHKVVGNIAAPKSAASICAALTPPDFSFKDLGHYEVYKVSASDNERSVVAFHELERRALPDLAELRSCYGDYPDDALDQPSMLMDKLVPAMREFERLEAENAPIREREMMARLVSDSAEDANYHTFNSWFLERCRKDGLDLEAYYEAMVCFDCLYAQANGWDERIVGYPLPDPAPLSTLPVGAVFSKIDEDSEAHFSSIRCFGCGSTLSGYRYDVVVSEFN